MAMLLQTATGYLKTFFSASPNGRVTLDELYAASNRDHEDPIKNRMWLSNKLTPLNRFGFVKGIYENRSLVALELTKSGREALDRAEINPPQESNTTFREHSELLNEISLGDMLKMVRRWREENPDFEIVFYVKPKE